MKYCTHCGAQINDEAMICMNCGCSTKANEISHYTVSRKDETSETIIKVFLIIGCLSLGWALLPLAWCIPLTVSIFGKMKRNESIGTGMKICTLLFVSRIAGIWLLCMDDK